MSSEVTACESMNVIWRQWGLKGFSMTVHSSTDNCCSQRSAPGDVLVCPFMYFTHAGLSACTADRWQSAQTLGNPFTQVTLELEQPHVWRLLPLRWVPSIINCALLKRLSADSCRNSIGLSRGNCTVLYRPRPEISHSALQRSMGRLMQTDTRKLSPEQHQATGGCQKKKSVWVFWQTEGRTQERNPRWRKKELWNVKCFDSRWCFSSTVRMTWCGF